jgi:predicted acyltransferase
MPKRLLSLDVMRGIIMILLAGESCRLYDAIKDWHDNPLVEQFMHHPWHGLHFWDLVQPAFMFMAGTGMYFSFKSKGRDWPHILKRCLKLFVFGTALHCVYAGHMVWELWNVLTQLSVTTLIAYLLIDRSYTVQIVAGFVLLILNDVLYRTILMPGFDQPFTEFHNFGAYVDTLLMGKINPDGWVAINVIPTAAHTIWGVTAGKWLLDNNHSVQRKISVLLIAGVALLVLGFGADLTGISPIIKRISTAGFTLASAGWVVLMLTALYWWIDIKQHPRFTWIAVAVGMNSIFIYLFFETLGAQWLDGVVAIFVTGALGTALFVHVVSAFLTLLVEWYICYWLYQHKIFIKI